MSKEQEDVFIHPSEGKSIHAWGILEECYSDFNTAKMSCYATEMSGYDTPGWVTCRILDGISIARNTKSAKKVEEIVEEICKENNINLKEQSAEYNKNLIIFDNALTSMTEAEWAYNIADKEFSYALEVSIANAKKL
jgi:hypothetical protein